MTVKRNDQSAGRGHQQGTVNPELFSSKRGVWALRWSFVGLLITASLQIIVFFYSNSIALLADTIHNFGDAATAIPLWLAFVLVKRKPTQHFPYGYGKVEDLAGVLIVLIIFLSAVFSGYEAIQRLFQPETVHNLLAVIVAALIGFLGNEAVAVFRIRVGKEINSAALIADGYHARVDGFGSLGVLVGAIGVWMGFPLADPIVGLLITGLILKVVWDTGKSIFSRLLDGIDPAILTEIRHAVMHCCDKVKNVTEVRARWIGHRINAELNITVASGLTVAEAHHIVLETRQEILAHIPYLSNITIHVDPDTASGESFHTHEHEGETAHNHSRERT